VRSEKQFREINKSKKRVREVREETCREEREEGKQMNAKIGRKGKVGFWRDFGRDTIRATIHASDRSMNLG